MVKTQKNTSGVWGTISVLAAAWIILYVTKFRWASAEEAHWTALLYVLCCIPTVAFVAGHKFRIPLMPMWGLGYFMLFGVPLLGEAELGVFGWIPSELVAAALRLTVAGALACLIAFYSPLGQLVESFVPHLKLPWDVERAPKIGIALIIVGLACYYYKLTSPPSLVMGQLVFLLSQLVIVGSLTLFLLQLRGHLSRMLKVFLWGVTIPILFLMGLGTGALWQVIRSLAPLLFCYAAERRRLPWVGMAVLAISIIPFLGFKHEYRSYAWHREEPETMAAPPSPIERGLAFVRLTSQRLTEGGVESYAVAAETAEARVNHLQVLATVMDMTPSLIPYWRGETYQTLWWVLVPRFLFPEKPTKMLGQEFGHRYSLLHPEDFTTSFNLPHQVIEMYINFGTIGVVIGMIVVGLVYRTTLTLLSHPDSGERGIIIGCALLGNLMALDSDFSLVFGGLFYYVALMAFFTRFLQPRTSTA